MSNRILYVDDEPKLLDAFKRVFKNEPFECVTFQSAQKALQTIEEIKPTVVISDQRMTEMSGTEFLDEVKQIKPDTIRMIITGFPDYQVAMSAINQGHVYRFLEKPWDEDMLKTVVKEAFSHHEMMKTCYDFSSNLSDENECKEERLIGVRELAGAVSHSLCQPVQVIQGYADIMQMRIHEKHELFLYLANLQKQIHKMKEILTRIQSIKKYKVCIHAGNLRMIDIEKASSET